MSFRVGSAVSFLILAGMIPLCGQQSGAPYKPPRTPDGKPDLQGIWKCETPPQAGNLDYVTDTGALSKNNYETKFRADSYDSRR